MQVWEAAVCENEVNWKEYTGMERVLVYFTQVKIEIPV